MNKSFQALCARLQAAGVPDARFDAAQLYRFVTGRDPRLDDGPDEAEARRLEELAVRRAAREPLQYLLGEWDFLDFTLKVGPGVLCRGQTAKWSVKRQRNCCRASKRR